MSINGMAGGLSNRNFRQSLSYLPNPKTEHIVNYDYLTGGLNLYDLDYRLKTSESPNMRNLLWQDGQLKCRRGQRTWFKPKGSVGDIASGESTARGYAAYKGLYYDKAFVHATFDDVTGIYMLDLTEKNRIVDDEWVAPTLVREIPDATSGTFFRYRDELYYKTRGGYYKIAYNGESFSCTDVEAYRPIILTGTHPTTHAGIEYQPENRLAKGAVEVWYSVPEQGEMPTRYYLPTTAKSIDGVTVDGVETTAYTVGPSATGIDYLDFAVAPPLHTPYVSNTVKIKYTGADYYGNMQEAYDSIMSCTAAAVYGSGQGLCIVFGNAEAQGNAFFWNGNHIVMDAGYFPMEQYNLVGDNYENITAFAQQQDLLIIFKEHSLWKTTVATSENSVGRTLLTMNTQGINTEVGCDMPRSIQLIDNNLVFANSRRGVYILCDTSDANENNVFYISKKIDGSEEKPGLDSAIRRCGGKDITSFDDSFRYWLVVDNEAYVWDYTLSNYTDPSWFKFTNINAMDFISTGRTTYFSLDKDGWIVEHMQGLFSDRAYPQTGKGLYTEAEFKGFAIEKVYTFATQMMHTYDYLKDVRHAIFVIAADTATNTEVWYETDYETRKDLVDIEFPAAWRLYPRFLNDRNLDVRIFDYVARRRPMCRHIRHFAMRLQNNNVDEDLSVISAQMLYVTQGRDKGLLYQRY